MSQTIPSPFLGGMWPWTLRTSLLTSPAIISPASLCCISSPLKSTRIAVFIVPVLSAAHECCDASCSFPKILESQKCLAQCNKAWSTYVWLIVTILPLRLTMDLFLSTSINLIMLQNSLLFLKFLAQELLWWPQELLPPDCFVCPEVWSFPCPLGARCCAPPVDDEG